MGSPPTERNLRSRALLLAGLMLLSLMTVSPAQAAGEPANLQAHGISATFDPVTEVTTITWNNSDTNDGAAVQGFQGSDYKVYRHTSPINASNVGDLTPFATLDTCDMNSPSVSGNPFNCRGSTYPAHSVSFPVPPGVNGSFYYAVTTLLNNGTEAGEFILNESHIYEPVVETTTAVQTPIILTVEFEPAESETTIRWYNYNDLFSGDDVHPETGDDAMTIRVWRTDYALNRELGPTMVAEETPIAELPANATEHVVSVPMDTERSSYYSITYHLPNYSGPGEHYEDVRFLGDNTMTEPVLEDNRPPDQPILTAADFVPEGSTGTGNTVLSWNGAADEVGETYRVYRSDEPFNSTLAANVQLVVSDIHEDAPGTSVPVTQGFLGYSYYCVVTVDASGVVNTNTTANSCTNAIFEDAFYNWIAEPTNVNAEFIGDRTVRVTWNDQLGVDGEIYHIWHIAYPNMPGSQFVENQTANYLGTVSDSVGEFEFTVDAGNMLTEQAFCVTTEALYGNVNGTYHYTQLNQNCDSIPVIDTTPPLPARIRDAFSLGSIQRVSLEWLNDDAEANETYSIWRHYGSPFGADNSEFSDTSDEGWEMVLDDITGGASGTIVREFDIADDVDRDVWYAIAITDTWGNTNSELFAGFGGNAFRVSEDTRPANATLTLLDSNGDAYEGTTLVSGQYTLHLQLDEDLYETPTIDMFTPAGMVSGEDDLVSLINDNRNNPDVGPLYSYDFSISTTTSAGQLFIHLDLQDEWSNTVNQSWNHLFIDAQLPQVTIFAPTPSNDGSKYLYGNRINLLAGAEDDVGVTSFQYRFTYHYGGTTGQTQATPWSDLQGITVNAPGNASLTADMEVSAGNFEPGFHRLSVRATDAAGNEVLRNVEFIVDYCRNRLDGTTSCTYEESLQPPLEPEVITPALSDPPYVVVFVVAIINVMAIVVALLVIQVSMSGPKKKKKRGDDDDEDEDWMAEFMGGGGGQQELDMDSVTGTGSSEEKKEEAKEEESKASEEKQVDDDDPFAINIVQRKTRRKKKKAEPEPEDDDDDDDDDDDEDDDDDDDDDEDEKPKRPVRRSVGRKPAPRKAPVKRRAVKRKSDDD